MAGTKPNNAPNLERQLHNMVSEIASIRLLSEMLLQDEQDANRTEALSKIVMITESLQIEIDEAMRQEQALRTDR